MNVRVDVYHHFTGDGLEKVLKSLKKLEDTSMTNQEKLNTLADAIETVGASLTASTDGLREDIQALKAAVQNGEALDFTSVDQKVVNLKTAADALTALDAQNPEPLSELPAAGGKKGKASNGKAGKAAKGKKGSK